ITITPPEYAKATIPVQSVQGLHDLSVLQHGRIHFAFRFTRPAEAVFCTWSGAGVKLEAAAPRSQPEECEACAGAVCCAQKASAPSSQLTLSPDCLGATLELPIETGGTFQLLLLAEHGIRTELDTHSITARIDEPPVFGKVTARDSLKVLPYDRV